MVPLTINPVTPYKVGTYWVYSPNGTHMFEKLAKSPHLIHHLRRKIVLVGHAQRILTGAKICARMCHHWVISPTETIVDP